LPTTVWAVTESFPQQHARTRRFTLGAPRGFSVSDDGSRVVFLRTRSGDDPVSCVWISDTATGAETMLVDAVRLLDGQDAEAVPAEEMARRERTREAATGVVTYAVGGFDGSLVSFALGGRPYVVNALTGELIRLGDVDGVFDVRVSPTGTHTAFVVGAGLSVWSHDEMSSRSLVASTEESVSWGSAEFVAGEEMGRTRGYWWSPDGASILAARVDVAAVQTWYLADPTAPEIEPRSIRYPSAGTTNAEVGLAIVGLDGSRVGIDWNADGWEYLADVSWTEDHGLTLVVQSRDQRRWALLGVDEATGAVHVVHEIVDDLWVELVEGMPSWWGAQLLTVAGLDDGRRMFVGGEAVTGPELWVRKIVGTYLGGVVFTASADPTEVHVYRWTPAGVEQLTTEPGVHNAYVGGPTIVTTSVFLDRPERRFSVRSGAATHEIVDLSERPNIGVSVELVLAGSDEIRTAVLWPSTPADEPLPVLLDPYGGPHAQRVMASQQSYATSQWFADQGFVVIVADGRGTPGRGQQWERSVYGDLATLVLDDQIAALDAVAEMNPGRLDLTRVAIRGWSFGGYLAALAVLRRPDVFAAAVAGAPVTDWRLYDTHYTERYLGHPDVDGDNYDRSSLLGLAPQLTRPLMLIHGLADDNVVAAHTLQLSRTLLESGRPHCVLPLAGVSHMTPQATVAENLLLLQVDFLHRSLAPGS